MKTKTNFQWIAAAVITTVLASAAHAAPFINGAIQINSVTDPGSPGSTGLVFQDSTGNATTSIADAVGVKEWFQAAVISTSGSFSAIADGSAVTFAQPWIFANPYTPFWEVGGFSFNLTSSVVFRYQGGLAVEGTGFLRAAGFADTPGFWVFATQGDAADGKFSWNSAANAVPDGGTTVALLGISLLGLHGVRRKFTGH